MKKIAILFFLILMVGMVNAELLLNENFDYDAGTYLTDNGWTLHSGSGGIPVVNPGLTYSGSPTYPSQSGNAISIGGTTEDDNYTFTEITSGTVYISFLFNASDAGTSGTYFLHTCQNPENDDYYGRVFAKKDVTNLEFSLSQVATPIAYTNNDYNFDETYLIVLKYEFLIGDDEISLFVFPSSISHASEPEIPTLGPLTNSTYNANEIGGICIRQGLSGPIAQIDGIRVATTWDDAPLPVTLSSFEAFYSKNAAVLNWTTQSETDNLGFNLYRSENENGIEDDECLLINADLIPGVGTSFIPTFYSFTDEYLVLGGHTYYYWLQSVSTTNELELFGPVSVDIPYEGEIITVLSEFTAVYENSHPVLSWTTECETDNLGYFVKRSEDPNGYVLDDCFQLNSVIIPGMGNTSYNTDYTFIDENTVIEGHTYYYWLESLNTIGDVNVFGSVSLEIPDQGEIPNAIFETSLDPNYPNPFNPETTIKFNVKENEIGILSIYNLRGERIMKESFEAGNHQYRWNAEGLASGIYFYKLSSPTTNITKKMILMK
ncbi:MAG: T9SS type A sorting domain-containing protein [Candidatus Cloacimonadales bacterium]|nr:T9SS type A sorting domain-containing protein [Candidatus Cloacimonadales bacterium]